MYNYHILPAKINRDITLCGNNIYPAPALHPDRIMQEHDLLFITSGTWSIAIEDQQYPCLVAGDAVFLRSGVRHRGLTPCSSNTRTQFIHFNTHPQDRYLSLPAPPLSLEDSNHFYLPPLVHCQDLTTMEGLFTSMSHAFWSHREDKNRTMNILLELILNEICHYAYSSLPNENEWCSIIVKMFRDNPSVTYSAEELAAIVNMSPRTLSRRFADLMGVSIRQYQINLKLELAYTALSGSGIPIKEIAMQYGFCDAYYFSRMFKKKYGFSPNQIKDRAPSENIYRIYR